MTRKYRYIWVALALALVFSACAAAPQEQQEPEEPTLPSFPQMLTPMEQLSAALDKTLEESSYEVRYGTRSPEDGDKAYSQTVSQTDPLDWDKLYQQVPNLPDRADLISRFCGLPLRAIPSNTGAIRYEVADLDETAAAQLLYREPRAMEPADALWAVALLVDAAGRLSGLEITGETQTETIILFLELTFPDSP